MCVGQPSAVQPTHGILTATLILPPSGAGVIIVPPVTTLSTSTTTATTKRTTTTSISFIPPQSSSSSSSTTTIITQPTTTTFVTRTSTTSAATATSTETNVPAAADQNDGSNDDDKSGLSKAQVVGISVGVAAAAVVALGAILVARYCRRRNYPQVKTGFFPMRNTWDYKPDKKRDDGSTNSWIAHQITAPLDPNPVTLPQTIPPPPPPKSYSRGSWRPEAIGLAISPPQSRVVTQTPSSRRESKLLPAKPVLSAGPSPSASRKTSSPPSYQQSVTSQNPYYSARSSTTLQNSIDSQVFEATSQQQQQQRSNDAQATAVRDQPRPEPPMAATTRQNPSPRSKPQPPAPLRLQIPQQRDLMAPPRAQYVRDSDATEFEEDGRGSLSPNGQVWRPPSANPHSATTYYVADKYGNWVLGDPNVSQTTYIAELDAPSPPTAGPRPEPAAAAAAASEVSPQSGDAQETREQAKPYYLAPAAEISRSGEFTRSSSVYSQQSAPRGGPYAYPVPPLPFSSQSNPRRSSLNRRRSAGRSLTRPRATSTDSGITTITTSSEDTSSDPSPPAEQQGSLSPVVESPGSGTGRSPVTYPKIPGRDHNRPVNINNNSSNNNNRLRVEPPPSRPMVYYPPGQPSPTLGVLQVQPAPGSMASSNVPRKGRRPVENPGLPTTGSPTMRVVEPSPEPEPKPGPALDDRAQLPSAKARSPPFFFNASYPTPLSTQQRPPPQPPQSVFSSKRNDQFHQPESSISQERQQQQQQQQVQQPNVQSYRPYIPPPPLQPPEITHQSPTSEARSSGNSSLLAKRVGFDRAADMAIPTNPALADHSKWRREGLLSPDAVAPNRSGDLPATPIWVPRLTPTRRGEDLFLNVQ